MTPQQEAKLERLTRLRSYQACSQPVQSALKLHLLYGIDGIEALSTLSVRNQARTWESPKVQAVLKDMEPDIATLADRDYGAILDDIKPPQPPKNDSKSAPEAPSQPLQATAEPQTVPVVTLPPVPRDAWGPPAVPGLVCEDCHGHGQAWLDSHCYCARCFKTRYWKLHPIPPAPLSDPTDTFDALGETIRAREAALQRKVQAQIEASPHASMEKVFAPGKGVPPEVLAIHPNARMATREENEAAWQGFDQEQASERESLVSEYLAQERAAREQRANKIQNGWRY